MIVVKEKHIAYKICEGSSGLVCTQSEYEEEKMCDLLKEIRDVHAKGIFWIFKQLKDEPQRALCIIDCEHNRIYYHYSGEVEEIDYLIEKLSQKKG